jgi:hypothetical protein
MKTEEEVNRPTSATEYRNTPRQRPANTVLVTVPSGAKWELAQPDFMGYIATGRMPQSLVLEFLASAERRGVKPEEFKDQEKAAEIAVDISTKETVNALIFMRTVVEDACINPRIVVGGTGDDELDPTEVKPEDFKFIFQWCMSHSGVAGLAGLQTFRGGRKGRTSGPRADGARQRKKSVVNN